MLRWPSGRPTSKSVTPIAVLHNITSFNRSAKLDVLSGCVRNALRTGFTCSYMFLHVFACFGRFLMFLHVFAYFGQKSGRPVFGVFVKHVVELYNPVKTKHVMFPQAMDQTLSVREH